MRRVCEYGNIFFAIGSDINKILCFVGWAIVWRILSITEVDSRKVISWLTLRHLLFIRWFAWKLFPRRKCFRFGEILSVTFDFCFQNRCSWNKTTRLLDFKPFGSVRSQSQHDVISRWTNLNWSINQCDCDWFWQKEKVLPNYSYYIYFLIIYDLDQLSWI